MNTTTSLKQISLATSAVFAATMTFGIHRVSAGTIISDRTQLNTILGGSGVTENFENYNVPDGDAQGLQAKLDSSTVVNGQGPGLVVNGVTFVAGSSNLQWNGANYFGSPSKELLANGQPMNIDFSVPVNAFGLDLRAYQGFGDTATVTIFGTDDSTVLDTISPIGLAGTGVPVFFGYQDIAGIGKIELTPQSLPWSPIIDNLTFGQSAAASTPEPSTVLGLGLLGLGALVKRQLKPKQGSDKA
ncbi:PEP-CTERM sorting domain-containing protein [Microcystis aeruginosa]|uniref:Uncharacterized protein n=1 Tax=Microcystis aeruginosa NIES-298 TaxID=449468 RepID=A0A2H6BPN4_MICAE|nr:PEP-CTERM sorting domain-containing protein [Microcystis aeruginosa]GBD52164.1 hypothetical protein BGM30_12570 [Microcystis aeruginosa NIES-298]GBE97815.1 PEP-CTERM domain protein [Microcystis aeruginosa NIES-298]